jgi:chorismate mutase
LKVRKLNDVSDEYTQKMKKLRANIDVLDATARTFRKRMKVADEMVVVKETKCCGIAKHPMERDIRKMILDGNQGTFRRVCFKIIQSHSPRKYQPSR